MDVLKRICIELLLLTVSAPGFAALTVIGDNGSIDATSYLSGIVSTEETSLDKIPVASMLAPFNPQNTFISDPRFPVVSDLTPGRVLSVAINNPGLVQPFFVVGNDVYSQRWMSKHFQQLQKWHALGVVTNVSASDFHALQTTWKIPLVPASLDGISHLLPVTHYPFLFYQGWIIQ